MARRWAGPRMMITPIDWAETAGSGHGWHGLRRIFFFLLQLYIDDGLTLGALLERSSCLMDVIILALVVVIVALITFLVLFVIILIRRFCACTPLFATLLIQVGVHGLREARRRGRQTVFFGTRIASQLPIDQPAPSHGGGHRPSGLLPRTRHESQHEPEPNLCPASHSTAIALRPFLPSFLPSSLPSFRKLTWSSACSTYSACHTYLVYATISFFVPSFPAHQAPPAGPFTFVHRSIFRSGCHVGARRLEGVGTYGKDKQ